MPSDALEQNRLSTSVMLDQGEELELSDADILDAMREIPGYLDITTADFRVIYHLAHDHALERMNRRMRAGRLMRSAIQALRPDTTLGEAAPIFVRQRLKTLPVVIGGGRVDGVLTETDILRRLGAESFLELLERLAGHCDRLATCCKETRVGDIMTSPAVTVMEGAGFAEIMKAFRRHPGRAMPVVDGRDRLLGLLMRKDFLTACQVRKAE